MNKIKFLQTYGQSCVHHNQPIDFLTILRCKEIQYHLF